MSVQRCCTTPRAVVFWAASFIVLYAVGLLTRQVWPALERYDSAVLLLALGGACVLNAARNGTDHCGLTGPLFLALAVAEASDSAGLIRVPSAFVWATALLGTAGALLLEYRFKAREQRRVSNG
jgi:hypothetical protein